MYWLYSCALTLFFFFMLPVFIYQAARHGKYIGNFRERLGRLPESVKSDHRPTIWVHTVSVGEFNAARPLLERIKSDLPHCRLVVSTTTMTGQRLARASYPEPLDGVFYFPFDWRFSVRRALAHIRPAAVVILETELWANFLRQCKERDILTLVANGRISPRSFSRYRRVRGFISGVLNDVSLLVMQSEADAGRALALGADAGRVRVCGNIKYDIAIRNQGPRAGSQALNQIFAFAPAKPLIVAGSTAPGEEEMVLEAFREVRRRAGLEQARLLVAPRHPERFDEVAALLQVAGFRFVRRSHCQGASSDSLAADIILLDTIGELAAAYEFAAVVFVGGSLVPRGGHNPIEPAAHARPIVVGPHTTNFRQIILDFAAAGAIVQIEAGPVAQVSRAFAQEVRRLLEEREEATAMGGRALELLSKNRGATDCVFAAIRELLGPAKLKGDD